MAPSFAEVLKLAISLRPERNTIRIIIMLQKFCFQFCHIHIAGTFRFTAFATQAQIHHFINLFMIEAVTLSELVRNSLKIFALALVVSFSFRVAINEGHMVPPDKCVLRQSPRTIALFCMLQHILVMKTENRFKFGVCCPGV